MKKEDFLKQKGMKIRKVTPSDKKVAKTDYQRKANYIIKTKSGKEYFSSSGTLKDCIAIDKLNQMQKKEKKQNVQKTTGNRVKTTTTRRQQLQREEPKSEIVVSLGITLIDKYNVLDDYYSWLFKNSYDANQAVVLNEYKKHLRERERL